MDETMNNTVWLLLHETVYATDVLAIHKDKPKVSTLMEHMNEGDATTLRNNLRLSRVASFFILKEMEVEDA